MNRIVSILIIHLITVFSIYGHKGLCVVKTYANIKTRIETGRQFEEIHRIEIIGQLAQKLSEDIGSKELVYLDFHHDYTSVFKRDLALGINPIIQCGDDWDNKLLHGDYIPNLSALNLHIVDKHFDIIETLKLLEFALLYKERIRNIQKTITDKGYPNSLDLRIKSINRSIIDSILNAPLSNRIVNLINQKITPKSISSQNRYSYYWKSNKFFVTRKEQFLLQLDDISSFTEVDGVLFAFDTDSTFHFVDYHKESDYQKKWVIKDLTTWIYPPIKIKEIGLDKYALIYRDQTAVFFYNKKQKSGDLLIHDLNQLTQTLPKD